MITRACNNRRTAREGRRRARGAYHGALPVGSRELVLVQNLELVSEGHLACWGSLLCYTGRLFPLERVILPSYSGFQLGAHPSTRQSLVSKLRPVFPF